MISASSSTELLNRLAKIDEPVPRRNEGRKSHHVETHSLVSWLLAMNSLDRLSYPLEINRRESPDYEISEGSDKYGLELTEATIEGYAKTLSMRDREAPDELLSLGDPELYKDMITEDIRESLRQSKLTSPGWEGDEVEIYTAEQARKTVEKKQKLLISKYEKEYSVNHLLIYALLPTPSANPEVIVECLCTQFSDYWRRNSRFLLIYLEVRGMMYVLSERNCIFAAIPR